MVKLKNVNKIISLVLLFAIGVLLLQYAVATLDKFYYPQDYSDSVEKYASEFNISQELIYAVIHTESGFNANSQSDADARGLMQITNETFEWIKLMIASSEDLSFDDMYDPDTNIRFGAYFLSVAQERYNGDIATTAAAYHSGMGLVGDLLSDEDYTDDGIVLTVFPYEQMNYYVYKIQIAYNKYMAIYNYKPAK